jgi:hypothetical protein
MASGSWKKFSSGGYASTSNEIKSHSSVLFNERVNTLFMMLDVEGMDAEIKPDIRRILKPKALLGTIWREVRPIVSNNPAVQNVLKLKTTHPGIYTVDSGFAHVQECVLAVLSNPEENNSYEKLYYIIQQLQAIEVIIREVLQYFKYFIRPEYVQKPDINVASKKYEEMADKRTVDEFKELLGDKSIIMREGIEMELDEEYFDNMDEVLEEPEE